MADREYVHFGHRRSVNPIHVVPTWQEHVESSACWCSPLHDDSQYLFGPGIWIHRLANDGPQRIDSDKDPGPQLGGWRVVEALRSGVEP